MTQQSPEDEPGETQDDAFKEELKQIKRSTAKSSKPEKVMKKAPETKSQPMKPKKKAKICNVCFQIAGTPVADPGYELLHC